MLKLMLTPTFCTGMVATMLTPTTPLVTTTMYPTWAMDWDTTCPTSTVTMPTQGVRTTWDQLSLAFRQEDHLSTEPIYVFGGTLLSYFSIDSMQNIRKTMAVNVFCHTICCPVGDMVW